MNFGLYPVKKAGYPDVEFGRPARELESLKLWLKIGPLLELGVDVYNLEPTHDGGVYETIALESLSSFLLAKNLGGEWPYPRHLHEDPVAFSGSLATNGQPISAAGIIFRSGHRRGWVNIHPKS